MLSNFILNVLEKERIQRREAQGLMSRMIDHTTCNPRDLARASSHRRYLTNLTSTHTRACYKCKQYLALNIMDKKDQGLENASDRFFELLLTKNLLDKYKHILCCPVCEEQTNKNNLLNMKGNRRHFTHFCKNERILNFRNGVNKWLEELISKLIQNIDEMTGENNGMKLIFEINKTLRSKNIQNLGKIDTNNKQSQELHETKFHPNNYVSITEWCQILQIDNIQQGTDSGKDPLQHIFGLRTALKDGALEEKNMGVVDCIGFGLIPKALNNTINKFLKHKANNILDRNLKTLFLRNTSKLWNRIQSVAKGRGIGIHRVTKEIISEREKVLRERYSLPKKSTCKRQLESRKEEIRDELDKLYLPYL